MEYQKDVKRKQNKVGKGRYTRDLTVEPAVPNHTFEIHARRDKGFKLFYVVRGHVPKVLGNTAESYDKLPNFYSVYSFIIL